MTPVRVAQALVSIRKLTVAECERAFDCELRPDDTDSRQYWGASPDLQVEVLDVRIGQTGGVVMAQFDGRARSILAEELDSFGPAEDMDIVSPPMAGAPTPRWRRKWSVAHTITGVKIWFGLEEVEDGEILVYACRRFVLLAEVPDSPS